MIPPGSSRPRFLLLSLILTALPVASRAAPAEGSIPRPLAPAADEVLYAPHPHFRWQREDGVEIEEWHRIQIARDAEFKDVVCDDRLQVVSRFVPVDALAPGRYRWRVRRGDGAWSASVPFEVRRPERAFTIRAGSEASVVERILLEAAAGGPAQVDFEPGDYSFAPAAGACVATIAKARDLAVDGHGARLSLSGTFLHLVDCRRVTLCRFTVTSPAPGHTLVRILNKDAAGGRLTVKAAPGYDPDVSAHFKRRGVGNSFVSCVDPARHGRYLPGAGVTSVSAGVAPSPDEPGAFVFSPVKADVLDRCPSGGAAVVTAYGWQWVRMDRSEECTFDRVTTIGLPGAFCGGSDTSAKSYLSCRVLRREPADYFGGHSAVGNGAVGEWIEGCEFECLADDGPAEQALRMKIRCADGPDALSFEDFWTNREWQPGDRIALVNPANFRSAAARVKSASPGTRAVRVQLDRPLTELSGVLKGRPAGDWSGVFVYRDTRANEDFVYRRNRHVGGRGHGVKYNGTRAWIADNHFENISGNAVLAGFTSELAGHGASEAVVSGNTIVCCGWTPISLSSKSKLATHLVVWGNRVDGVRESAVDIRGCRDVTVAGNEFSSAAPPEAGAWVTALDSQDIRCEGNRHPAGAPEFKATDGKR